MSEHSDKPLVVDGVTVRPKWAWSPEHRAHVAETIRAVGKTDRSPDDRAAEYVRWYAERHGITEAEARERITEAA